MLVTENLKNVEEKIAQACLRSGRSQDEVTLIAVSKTKPVEMMQEAIAYGITTFGENKVQEITEKQKVLTQPLNWHMIGHLQTNKVKYIVDKVALVHSVDSVKLARQISKEALKHKIQVPVLIQVNLAREETKSGFMEEELFGALEEISRLPGVLVQGLMQIAPFVENPENNRVYFRRMRQLFVDIKEKNFDNIAMNILSMGMTNDYQVAVEEGSTMVRVGTGIFGERDYNK